MYNSLFDLLLPVVEDDVEAASEIAEEVLEAYATAAAGDLEFDDDDLSVDDALDVFYEPPSEPALYHAVVSLLHHAGCHDVGEPLIDVTTDRLLVGGPDMLTEVANVVPGVWSVIYTRETIATVSEEVVYDEDDGSWESFKCPVFGCAGVWVDPTGAAERVAALGPGVTPEGLTFKPQSAMIAVACHRRTDGRVDAIFITEVDV